MSMEVGHEDGTALFIRFQAPELPMELNYYLGDAEISKRYRKTYLKLMKDVAALLGAGEHGLELMDEVSIRMRFIRKKISLKKRLHKMIRFIPSGGQYAPPS